MSIIERIFSLINELPDKSPAGLCKVLGVGTSQTTNWKRRNTDPPAKYLKLISEYLDVSVEYLLTGEDSTINAKENLTDEEQDLVELYRKLDKSKKRIFIGKLEESVQINSDQGNTDTVCAG